MIPRRFHHPESKGVSNRREVSGSTHLPESMGFQHDGHHPSAAQHLSTHPPESMGLTDRFGKKHKWSIHHPESKGFFTSDGDIDSPPRIEGFQHSRESITDVVADIDSPPRIDGVFSELWLSGNVGVAVVDPSPRIDGVFNGSATTMARAHVDSPPRIDGVQLPRFVWVMILRRVDSPPRVDGVFNAVKDGCDAARLSESIHYPESMGFSTRHLHSERATSQSIHYPESKGFSTRPPATTSGKIGRRFTTPNRWGFQRAERARTAVEAQLRRFTAPNRRGFQPP